MNEIILVIDFGGQYNQLIARRVRENQIYSEVVSYRNVKKVISKNIYTSNLGINNEKRKYLIKGVILTGGGDSVYKKNSPNLTVDFFNNLKKNKIPLLGICYGMQIIAYAYKGTIKGSDFPEYGKTTIKKTDAAKGSKLYKGIGELKTGFMSHRDIATKISKNFKITSSTKNTKIASFEDETLLTYAVQYHPEVTHTPFGKKILKNFLVEICNCKKSWTMKQFSEDLINDYKIRFKGKKVLCALSGGVDSTVAATLLSKAIGKNLYCIFVDHGLLRFDEENEVMEIYKKELNLNIKKVDARKNFLKKLKGVIDPEKKRKIIGTEFINTFTSEAKKLEAQIARGGGKKSEKKSKETIKNNQTDKNNKFDYLLQGTIYPDVVESGLGGESKVIKSHHNVGGLPKSMKLSLIEPLRLLFKDEVRKLGLTLNINKTLIFRQPFPGPGLAIRIIGEITEEKLAILKRADKIVREEIDKYNQKFL